MSRDNVRHQLSRKCRLLTAPDSNVDPEETHTDTQLSFNYNLPHEPGHPINMHFHILFKIFSDGLLSHAAGQLLVCQMSPILGPSAAALLSTPDMKQSELLIGLCCNFFHKVLVLLS